MKLIGDEKIINQHYSYLLKFIKNIDLKESGYTIENIVI